MVPKSAKPKINTVTLHYQSVKRSSTLIAQFKALVPTLVRIYLPLLCILLIIRLQNRVPVENLTKDPLAVAGKPFYFGMLSQVGILFWCASAAICFFCAALLIKITSTKLSSFLFFSGCITTVLLLDDLFSVHEYVFPIYLKISETVIYLVYATIFSAYLINFRKTIQSTESIFLIIAFAFFGFSILIDSSFISTPQSWMENGNLHILEDGAKFIGIISWFTYFIRVGLVQVKQKIRYH